MNRLKDETSPYLLQHADNPVDWYPWGNEAFQQAQTNDKPILLSVGYSSCHWCHVMAHESFEHEPTAKIMNELYINIKVDREERPDVDDIYMQAVQAMTRSGGWPMTVFMMPDGRPFYAGTYYPLESRYGMPSFRDVLFAVHDAYVNRREEIEKQADSLKDALNRDVLNIGGTDDELNPQLLNAATKEMLRHIDKTHGGFGSQPKFPNPMNFEYLLRSYQRNGQADDATLAAVTFSLRKMARGGIYDQIGGGFARYSVDAMWLVPHFEKMMYDNAQLSRLYLHTWQTTQDPFFKLIAEDIYDYVLREMTNPDGAFYSSTDADSEGEEGKFFVWTMEEVEETLKVIEEDVPDAYDIAIEYWGMSKGGNFEGKNILYVPSDDEIVAKRLGLTIEEMHEKLRQIKDRLYATRTSRVHPGLDDKILTSWSSMMLASLAEAARVLKRDDYMAAAERCGDFMLEAMMAEDGRLYRTHKNGESKLNGYLEDYAHFIDALLELYQSTFVEKWFVAACKLADFMLGHFSAEDGGFFDTSDDHEALIVRPRNLQDNAIPSGNSMMAKQLIRLSAYTGDARYDEAARQIMRILAPVMQQYPQAFGEALNAADMLISGVSEVAIVGNPVQAETKSLLDTVRLPYRPNVITALAREDVGDDAVIPLLNYRTLRNDKPTAYVCRNFACANPVNTVDETEKLLNASL